MKQLVIFLDIVALIGQLQNQNEQSLNSDTGAVILELQIFAQDPSFSKLDEQLLHWLGVTILHTPSPTSGGEALSLIDENTVVYSPFLTFEAYKLFFERSEGKVGMWISDDFEALKSMGKGTRGEVDGLLRFFEKGKGWRRRVVGTGVGGEVAFWEEGEKAVPMAVYWKEEARKGKMVRMKSML